jgi:O-antigen/teichoic acid export membrane protein
MTTNETQNAKYKRMAKNAAMLYFRMLLTMVVALYTSRIVLQTLGVDDFGIFNVVAGFVTMLGFLNSAMSSATQRFLAFEIGKLGTKDVSSIFSMSMNIHIIIAIFVCLLGETVGLWFVQTQMSIPVERLHAAEWIFHLSLISFAVTIVSVPYNAIIIANERMSIFAWVSIVDVTLKLLIVFMLSLLSMDKLILYGMLTLCVIFIVFLTYCIYCNLYVEGAKFKRFWDQELFKTMMSYTGWNLWGNIAAVMSGQGVNVLLNIYFGPAVNAARAISMQVSIALNGFVQNIQVAINPQIIKSYAENNLSYMHDLVCHGAKYNFFVLFLLALPVLNNTEVMLAFWLDVIPNNTIIFTRLIICTLLIDSLSPPLMTAAQATGHIKLYQFVIGSILLLNIPISYAFLEAGSSPYSVFYAAIGLSIIALFARVYLISTLIGMSKIRYIRDSIMPVLFVLVLVLGINSMIEINMENSLLSFSISISISSVLVIVSIWAVGLKKSEQTALVKIILNIKKRLW